MPDFILPTENQGWWTPNTAAGTVGVGVPGGFDHLLAGGASDRAVSGTVRNVVTGYSADNTGVADATTAINAAITAAVSGDVVYLPAGTYRIDGNISVPYAKSGITFRGAGSQAIGGTTLVGNGSGSQVVMTIGWNNSWEGNTYQDVTGTATKGTSNLTVASSSSFVVDGFAVVKLANEEDDTRIQAGAAPTWSSGVFPRTRAFVHRVVAKPDAITVTIEPPLMLDATHCAPQIVHGDLVGWEARNIGVEGLRIIGGANAAHYQEGIVLARGIGCWIYDVYFERAGSGGSGNCIKLYHGYRNEVRKCVFMSKATTFDNSDGAIQYQWQTSLLIEDNAFLRSSTAVHGWNVGIYSDGYIHNSVHAYNIFDACNKNILIAHATPCMLNLYEGLIGQRLQHDAYFNSTSHNTLFRNWFSGRQLDGSVNPNGGYVSWFKRFSRNFVLAGNVWGWDGNNGTSAGELQFGYPYSGNDSYSGTAQPTAGDFWADWAAYKAGTYTGGFAGFGELDLDVEASFTIVHNYMSATVGTGAVTNATTDTLPASLFRTAKPDYFGSLAWPAIEADSPDFDIEATPAGYRYVNENEDYAGPSAPTFSTHPATQTATVGDTVTLTVAVGGSPAPTLQWRKGGVNISGATSSSLVLSNVQLSDAGSYDCVATSSEGTATSDTAVLTVNAAPSGGGGATINTLNVGVLNLP
jgi:hypothetical protein